MKKNYEMTNAAKEKDSTLVANAEAVANYNNINGDVLKVLVDKFVVVKDKYRDTMRNAIDTLDANKLVIDGFCKWNYDKDHAVEELEKARLAYENFRQHIYSAIMFLEDSSVSVTDFVEED